MELVATAASEEPPPCRAQNLRGPSLPPPPREMGWSRRGGQRGRGRPRGKLGDAGRSIPRAGGEGLAGRGTPERLRMGGPPLRGCCSVWAPLGTRGCSRCPAPGEARALPSLRSLSAFPPASRSQPLRRPPPRSSRPSCSFGKPGFSPEPPGAAPTAAPATRALHRPLRGGAGGKQAAAAWLLIHHLPPPCGSARIASSRQRWGRGEQGPPAPPRCAKMELWGRRRRPKRGQLVAAEGTGMAGGVSGRAEGAVRRSQSEGDAFPMAQRAPLRAAPSSAPRSPDTSLCGSPAAQPPRLPQKGLRLPGTALGSASA